MRWQRQLSCAAPARTRRRPAPGTYVATKIAEAECPTPKTNISHFDRTLLTPTAGPRTDIGRAEARAVLVSEILGTDVSIS